MRTPGRTRYLLVGGALLASASAVAGTEACGARSGLDVPSGFGPPDAQPADGPVLRGVHQLDCAEAGITYIYAMAEDNTIFSFYPTTAAFTAIGTLRCPAEPGATPFSMAVDHKGVAYVVFANGALLPDGGTLPLPGDGTLFRVSTKNAACEATSFVPDQHGFLTFGMGFVANVGDGGEGETLYVAADIPAALGTIDVHSFQLRRVASFPATGTELTGTGDGRLFGFYAPDPRYSPSYIVQIDPRTAAVLSSIPLPGVTQGGAWAFGFWGGDFYMFTAPDNTTTVVQRYRPGDGSIVEVATAPLGTKIVGAGVSTCAPQQ